jgi:hypothetical protein
MCGNCHAFSSRVCAFDARQIMRPPIIAVTVAPPVRAILPNADVPQLNQLITTIIRPLQEREEQALNQEVQLQ